MRVKGAMGARSTWARIEGVGDPAGGVGGAVAGPTGPGGPGAALTAHPPSANCAVTLPRCANVAW